ncbi:MAG TPA: sigma-70 family RNA polymerase sigma factor [Puia sp.]|nr:sigma-70 family RNA polymerase sigma factor [Puia sp.]
MYNERLIIEKAKKDPKIFGQLYDAYYPKIFGYIFRVTGDYSTSCDITSETFLKAWMKINSFNWRGISISSWFYKIASNELNQYFRKKKYTPYNIIDLSVDGLNSINNSNGIDNAHNKMELNDEFTNIHQKLKKLSPKYQKVIALRYFEEMSIKEIGEIMGKKEGTVKSLISRGLEKLKNIF